MIVNGDIKALEAVVAADWYNDTTLIGEIKSGVDLHQNNQDSFSLPDRVTAKRLMFKTLYGGSAYGFAHDSDFLSVGFSEKQWKEVLEKFYDKYTGIAEGHKRDLLFVKEHGYLEIPSGRHFNFKPEWNGYDWKWPERAIKNYPIQGFGADLVKLIRIKAFELFKASQMEGEFIGTIHDSIIFDVPSNNVDKTVTIINKAVDNLVDSCYTIYKYPIKLPLQVEVQVGANKLDLIKYSQENK